MISGQNKTRLAVVGIFLIAIIAFTLDFPETIKKTGLSVPAFLDKPFSLGLDLQGGTHLIYQADVSEISPDQIASSIEGVRDVVERRVNAFGVAEPLVQVTKSGDNWRLIIELAGIFDINEAIGLIGETPLLEFKEQNPNPQIDLTAEQQTMLEEFNQQAKTKAEEILRLAQEPDANFAQLAQENSDDTGSAQNGGDLGLLSAGILIPEFEEVCFNQLAIGEVSKELLQTQFGYHIVKKIDETEEGDQKQFQCSHILKETRDKSAFLDPNDGWINTGLNGSQLKRAQVVFDPTTNEPQISVEFNGEGADLFENITGANVGKPIAIFLDGLVITPTVQSVINDGRAVISGNFTIPEAKLLSQRLNAGALPVPIELISQQTVGASLGHLSVEKSLKGGIIGLILVSIFMLVYYRLLGFTSILALLFYGLIVLGVFKMIPVTLTLAGLAGFTLSLGMAVDANILIFERIKEELKDGKHLPVAINEGFKRAWPSILDGNVSTLITCLVLIGFTTSLVKGFAITLSIGIILSMFSAMVVTKMIIKQLIKFKFFTNLAMFGISKKHTK